MLPPHDFAIPVCRALELRLIAVLRFVQRSRRRPHQIASAAVNVGAIEPGFTPKPTQAGCMRFGVFDRQITINKSGAALDPGIGVPANTFGPLFSAQALELLAIGASQLASSEHRA
jgi:hypothetical protein